MEIFGEELIGRQPIINAKNEIFGYEFFAREDPHILSDKYLSSARVLMKIFSAFPAENLLNDKPALVNFTDDLFDEKSFLLFPPEKIIPEFTITGPVDENFYEKLVFLKNSGFRIAIDRFSGSEPQKSLLKIVDFVKIDMIENFENYKNMISILEKFGNKKIKKIASRVEKKEIADNCIHSGFDYLQGFFFMETETLSSKKLPSSQKTIFHILNLLMDESSTFDQIEESFQKDPTLTYQLLRYLNSAGLSRGSEIKSIRHALMMLGKNPLQRWLTLLMFVGESNHNNNLLVMANVRAKLCESIRQNAENVGKTTSELHKTFLISLFSLMDILLGVPLAILLEDLNIGDSAKSALLERIGEDGKILRLAEAVERSDRESVDSLSKELGITKSMLNRIYLSSMAWGASCSIN